MNAFATGMLLTGSAAAAWWLGRFLARRTRNQPSGTLTVAELARRMDVPVEQITGHQPHYSIASIPKRNGGTRTLTIPDPQTKFLQRRLLRRVLAGLNSHSAACGFESGKSIVDAARPHVGRSVVIRLDIVDFFQRTTTTRLANYFQFIGWDDQATRVLLQLTTHENGLPQGAPTSPRLSNLVNGLLDAQLAGFVTTKRGDYTRYADDMTMSFRRISGRKIRGVIQQTQKILANHGYELHLDRKLHIRRRHQRQEILGLVVNSGVRLSRKKRRWLRAVRHRLATTGDATLTVQQLEGWDAFEQMIETQR